VQSVHAISADVSIAAESIRAVNDATLFMQTPPEYVFCCAGLDGYFKSNSKVYRRLGISRISLMRRLRDKWQSTISGLSTQ
jgi:hypothetical protein